MSGLHLEKMTLSPLQAKKLMQGKRVKLIASHLHGKDPVHLTKRQLNKLQKNRKLKKGMMLAFSPKQVKHHAKHGGNIFSSIGNFFKKTIPSGVKKAYTATKDVVTDPAFKKNFKKYFDYSFHMPASLLRKVPGMDAIGTVSDALKSVGVGLKRTKVGKRVKGGDFD